MAHVREIVRKDGATVYESRWRQNGKFKQRTFKVKRDAERFALRVEDEIEKGNSTDIYVKRSKTVADIVEALMVGARDELKPSTFNSYRASYDNHVLPSFGQRRITSVTSQEVEDWVRSLKHDKGLSSATVRNNFVALTKVFKYAQKHDLVVRNPCSVIKTPQSHHEEESFVAQLLTGRQVETAAALLDARHPSGLLLRFAAYTGLRAGELAALQIGDVDLLHGEIQVRRSTLRLKGGWVTGKPKSKRSIRDVPILSSDLRERMEEYLDGHPRRHEPSAALWPGRAPSSGAADYERTFDATNYLRWYLRPALRELGMPEIRLHDLRHIAASLWLASGIPPYKVSRWLGHASLATTDKVYSHLYPSDHESERSALDAYLQNEPSVVGRIGS